MKYTAQEFLKYKEKEQLTYTDDEVIQLMEDYASEFKLKSEKWDALDEEIGAFYNEETYDAENDCDFDGSEGDLGSIGEVAAIAFGYL